MSMPVEAASKQVLALRALVPLAHVADVRSSIEFYAKLGFKVVNTFENDGLLRWAYLENASAQLMLARSARPMNPDAQDVLFYLYTEDVEEYRKQLAAVGIKVGPMQYPFYAPRGEFRITDADGYCLMATHAG
jgi:catechol 2,3-dioxygenase-like lactoylglutathione lyase family enzyme